MSTTTHFHAGLYQADKAVPQRWKLLAGAVTVWQALAEGFAAARRYQELTGRGVAHDAAAARVFFEHYSGT